MASSPNAVECFLVDPAFVDQSKAINHVFNDVNGTVGSLTPKAMSFFNTPSIYKDKRDASTRQVNWTSETNPSIVVDGDIFTSFVSAINNADSSISTGIFRLIDKLMFDYTANGNQASIELSLVGDTDIAAVYVPGSFQISSSIKTAVIYNSTGVTTNVSVPAFCRFALTIPTGQTTATFVITLYTSVDAWILGYDKSTIVEVTQPLGYDKIYTSSLTSAVDNIFNISKATANIAFSENRLVLGNVTVSGMTQYNGIIIDSAGNTASVPFNILFKGREPTSQEIRAAIRAEITASGVGDEAGWKLRMPGIYVTGRFYVVPLWDQFYTKPNQLLYPSIIDYNVIKNRANRIMDTVGDGDVTQYMDILSVYYNKMTVVAVPDISGVLDVAKLHTVVPDYQSYAPTESNYAYMTDRTKDFANQLNTILAIDESVVPPGIYAPITENNLTFYSFVVERFEICVITKQCFTDILESTQ